MRPQVTEGVLIQDELIKLYSTLKREKHRKIESMRLTRRFLKPMREFRTLRMRSETENQGQFDCTAESKLMEYSILSLSSFFRASHNYWFTLRPFVSVEPGLKDNLNKWGSENTERLVRFIGKSRYFLHLQLDKIMFDLYGFSGLTIGRKSKKLFTAVEDPFSLLIYLEDDEPVGVGWIKSYSAFQLKTMFNFEPEPNCSPLDMFDIVCFTVPNREGLIKGYEDKGNYVQLFFYKGPSAKDFQKGGSIDLELKSETENIDGREIGERKYFSELPTVCPRDLLKPGDAYGDGHGERLLTPAMNSNKVGWNVIRSSTMKANPPIQAAHNLFTAVRGLNPGRMYPLSNEYGKQANTGIAPIEIQDRLDHQLAVLQDLRYQTDEMIPSLNMPEKKQRQSQYEIQQAQMRVLDLIFSYKMAYLTLGVSEHLRRIFFVARDLDVFTDLPQGASWDMVEPSMDSLLEGERAKYKAQRYVVTLNMCSPIIAQYREGMDNFKKDDAIRNIAFSQDSGDILHSEERRDEIREVRRRLMQQQQQMQQQMLSGQQLALRAKAEKDTASGVKSRTEAESKRLEGGF